MENTTTQDDYLTPDDAPEKAVIVLRGKGGELDRATLEIEQHEGGDFTAAVCEWLKSQVLHPGDTISLEDAEESMTHAAAPAKKAPTPQVAALPSMTPLGFKPSPAKVKNPYRIPARQAMAEAGLELDDLTDSIVPACCSEGCEVEPDGRCEHGCPSVMLAWGVI